MTSIKLNDHGIGNARATGMNAVQTYVAWNAHEAEPGKYNFEGDLDIVRWAN